MNPIIHEIEEALQTVASTIDRLRALGHEDPAFRLARLQYSAAIRASWPGNLAPLTVELTRIAATPNLGLSPEEQGRLDRAVATFRKVCQLA
ncbi:MAG: hypothetical protein MUF64_12580 [Polyangiaceae bacterium]|jgi:hypothetical protein|nr:hypothetical protein [Polyangiaceae bacterium]